MPVSLSQILARAAEHHQAGRLAEAAVSYAEGLALKPDLAALHRALADVLDDLGRYLDAEASCRNALVLCPHDPLALCQLGTAQKAQGRLADAETSYGRALALAPDLASAHYNLGLTRHDLGRADEAATGYVCALILAPDLAEAHNNLGNIVFKQGRINAALSCYLRAAAVKPGFIAAQRHLIAVATYCDNLDSDGLKAIHRRFGQAFAQAVPPPAFAPPHPGRRLRIGYLSADLHEHPVARNMLPVLRHHDRAAVSVHIYAHGARADRVTGEIRAQADGWCDITGLADAQVAEAVRADAIDILVSLAGRFDDNRPGVCTWRAAPVQISLHDVATSGLGEMDYLIADRWLAPRRSREYFSERVLRLPWFYVAAPPADLPAIMTERPPGPPVFGSFNNPIKFSPTLMRLWGRILSRLPEARLELRFQDVYAKPDLRRWVLDHLTQAGARTDQIGFGAERESRQDFLGRYNGIDVALDTLPFSGSTSTFQALSMGVPVVTWPQDRMVSRWTESMLRVLGLKQLIVASGEDYVALAVALAGDMTPWRMRRDEIASRLRASSLCDGRRWTRNVERFYRAVWRRHCAGL